MVRQEQLLDHQILQFMQKRCKDTSCYTEKGALKIPMANEEQMFLRPAIIAGQFIAPGNFSSGEMPDSTIFCLELLILPQRMRYLKHYR